MYKVKEEKSLFHCYQHTLQITEYNTCMAITRQMIIHKVTAFYIVNLIRLINIYYNDRYRASIHFPNSIHHENGSYSSKLGVAPWSQEHHGSNRIFHPIAHISIPSIYLFGIRNRTTTSTSSSIHGDHSRLNNLPKIFSDRSLRFLNQRALAGEILMLHPQYVWFC